VADARWVTTDEMGTEGAFSSGEGNLEKYLNERVTGYICQVLTLAVWLSIGSLCDFWGALLLLFAF